MVSSGQEAFELSDGALFAERYRVAGLLGKGGMGAVYRVRDLYLAEDVALKILPLSMAAHPGLALRFRQEVKLARRVCHPNIIRVHDIGEEHGMLFLTMELVEGTTLRHLLDGTPLPVSQAILIARAIAEGLSAAHAVQVIHRDLKPSNILIERSGRVVLSDFGIARLVDDELSLTQGMIGTPTYMAPEQATCGPMDGRTDLYALGVILYEMLTGERPSGTPAQLAARLEGSSAASKAQIPHALASLVLRCLSQTLEGRPPSAKAFLSLLGRPQEEEDEEEATGVIPPPHSPALDRTHALTSTSLLPAPCTLAVLPFRYRGPAPQSYLGEVLTDELVDALCRTRGSRVLGASVTARFGETRDALLIGRELGVGAVMDGAVQAIGERIRVTVRLIEASTGVQRWVNVHEGSTGDLFAFQESVVRRVSEDLRVELTTLAHVGIVPSEAIDRYLEARRDLRLGDFQGCRQAVRLLDEALLLAPTFGPALAARALATVRAYFYQIEQESREWEAEAKASIERARELASDLAEGQLAIAMFETQRGAYTAAASALARTLEIAPTCPPAHAYLGMLQVEAGRVDEGLSHLRLAAELEPTSILCFGTQMRIHALRGDQRAFEEAEASLLRAERPDRRIASMSIRMRAAAWRGDLGVVREILSEPGSAGQSVHFGLLLAYARAVLGESGPEETERQFEAAFSQARSPRLFALTAQLAAEAFAAAGQEELAMQAITRAADGVLIDVVWLERCPLLAVLGERPEMKEIRRRVRERAKALWG